MMLKREWGAWLAHPDSISVWPNHQGLPKCICTIWRAAFHRRWKALRLENTIGVSASWSRPQREGLILLMLGVRGGTAAAEALQPSSSTASLFSKLALDQIQRAAEMRNKRLVSSKEDVETELHLPPVFRTFP